MVDLVCHESAILGIIIAGNYHEPGVNFFTPDNFSQQVAFISHKKGKVIEAHLHNPVHRDVFLTQEVLHIKRGKLRVDFYTEEKRYLESRILSSGDTVVLVSGGHGFAVLEDVEMLEIKQGPYLGENDKTRFPGVTSSEVILPNRGDE